MSNDDQKTKKKKKTDGGEAAAATTEERTVLTVVLKIIDIHCEGCATKVKKSIRATEGVESVSGGSSKVTVVGDVDPEKLREMVEEKAKAKVELVSTVATKVQVKVKIDDAVKKKSGDKKPSEEEGKKKKKPEKEEKKKKKPEKEKKKKPEEEDKKKSKEAPEATTVVMKVDLHCDGCVQKIRKTITKTKGYKEMSIDEKNNTVTVKGTMDMKALSELLQNQLHKPVEIVPLKKEKTEEKPKEDNKKEANASVENIGALIEQNRIQFGYMNPNPPMYSHQPMYGHEFGHPMPQYHAPQMSPQMFSDENPNACYVM